MDSTDIDYDKINMIMTIKRFKDDVLISRHKISFYEMFLTNFLYVHKGVETIRDVYGFLVDQENFLGLDKVDKLNDDNLKLVLGRCILLKKDYEREFLKDLLPDYYCLLIDDINEEIQDAIEISKNI